MQSHDPPAQIDPGRYQAALRELAMSAPAEYTEQVLAAFVNAVAVAATAVPVPVTPNPARVGLLGDVHGSIEFFRAAIDRFAAAGLSTIVQLGDFGIWPHIPSGSEVLDAGDAALAAADMTVVVVPGNHENNTFVNLLPVDDAGFVTIRPRIRAARSGTRWEWSGRRFAAVTGAYSVDWPNRTAGFDWFPGAEEVPADASELVGDDPVDVLVCHDTAHGAPTAKTLQLPPQIEWASDENQRRVRAVVDRSRPSLLVHGHWHARLSGTVARVDVPASERTGEVVWVTTRTEGFAHHAAATFADAAGIVALADLSVTNTTTPARTAAHGTT